MEAANNGHLATVDLLLERGAKPDMQDQVSFITVCEGHRQTLC